MIATAARSARASGGTGVLERLLESWQPLGALMAIALAEVVTAIASVSLGLALHAGIVVALVWSGSRTSQEDQRGLLFALVVVPLIRIFSLCLPLNAIPRVYWYPAIMGPVLLAALMAARTLGYSARDVGLGFSATDIADFAAHSLLLVPVGLTLGVVEYLILKPAPITRDTSIGSVITAALVVAIATGFGEEMVFRGLIQHAAMWRFGGAGAVLYATVLFSAMHIGYLSLLDIWFVAGVGLLLAWMRWRTGSILGASLLHACVNVSLFLLTPLWLAPLLA